MLASYGWVVVAFRILVSAPVLSLSSELWILDLGLGLGLDNIQCSVWWDKQQMSGRDDANSEHI